MRRSFTNNLCALLALGFALTACGAHAQNTAERSVSPLIGTWTRDGNTPKGSGTGGPQFIKLTFDADGSLSASYVAAGVGALLGSAPSVKTESDTYATPSDSKLSIAEGSSHLAYSFRVSGSKLYLTPLGGGDAAVFTKAG
jgi:hypothetical protein